MALYGNSNEEKIWNYLISKGLNAYGVSGLMGNLFAESGLNPKNMQNTYEGKLNFTDASYTKAVDDGTYTNFVKDSVGYGLAQWTYSSRKQALYDYAKSKNKSVGDLEIQLEFLYKELNENFKPVLNSLKTATSVMKASNVVLKDFEIASNKSKLIQLKRAEYGQKYYKKYAKSNVLQKTMKYNSNNKPLVCMQTQSTCYTNTQKMTVRGVLWHSTGANNPDLKRYVQPSDNAPDRDKMIKLLGKNINVNDWNHIYHTAGMNCWIGKLADGEVTTIQTMPWDYKPWGCGQGKNGSCNDGWIQFEICEDGLMNKTYFDKVYKEACEITAYLCKMFNLNPKGTVVKNGIEVPVILCHADSCSLGLGSNHGDVLHWFKIYGKTMDDVRNDVSDLIGETFVESEPENVVTQTNNQSVNYKIENAQAFLKSLSGTYRTTSSLNLRIGAGMSKAIITVIPKGGKVNCYGYYTDSDGLRWYCVTYKDNSGVMHTGFVSSKYVKK